MEHMCWRCSMVVMGLIVCTITTIMAATEPMNEVTALINDGKWIHIVDERFLSLTIDPAVFLFGNEFDSENMRILSMARGLSPAYLRLGGPGSNHYIFQKYLTNGIEHENYTFTEAAWVDVNRFSQETGLELVFCLNILQRVDDEWDSRNSLELITFSDKMGYNISWELGYELQELGKNISAVQFGRDVSRLRKIVKSYPRYKNSLIIGPDITQFQKQKDVDFLKDYFHEGGPALDGITWHPKFTQHKPEDSGKAMGKLLHKRKMLNRALDRVTAKKPLWIGKMQKERYSGLFLNALTWAEELGTMARMGVQVIMQPLQLQRMFEPAPEYWVTVLHKFLVGRVVLDTKHSHDNKTHFHMYSHCTNMPGNHHAGELFAKAASYEHGAITFFGLNKMNTKVKATLEFHSGSIQNEEVHQYLLTPAENEQDVLQSRKTLLNGKQLNIEDEGSLPILHPEIFHTAETLTVTLPPASIGFWVLPGVKVKACIAAAVSDVNDLRHNNYRSHEVLVHSGGKYEKKQNTKVLSESTPDYEILDVDKEYPRKIKSKRDFKKHITIDNHAAFSNKNIKKDRHVRDGNFENNIRDMKDSKMKKYILRVKEKDGIIQGRVKRYAPEMSTYFIPGLHSDYFHHIKPKSSTGFKNSIWKRNRGGRFQTVSGIPKHESNIHSSLYDPRNIGSLEDKSMRRSSEESAVPPFPTGNVYMKQGGQSSEERSNDYDYIDKDEDMHEDDENVLPEEEQYHGPTEFFETFHSSRIVANDKFVGYNGELSEAETVVILDKPEEENQNANDNDDDKIIHEENLTEAEDIKAKAEAVRMLSEYYDKTYNDESSKKLKDFSKERRLRVKDKINKIKRIDDGRKTENRESRLRKVNSMNDNYYSAELAGRAEDELVSNNNDIVDKEHDNGDSYASDKDVQVVRNRHKVKEMLSEDIPEEYYKEDSHTFRSRKRNAKRKKTSRRNQIAENFQSIDTENKDGHHTNEDYDASISSDNLNALKNDERTSKKLRERTRNVSHKNVYTVNNENESILDILKDYVKEKNKDKKKNRMFQKLSQRRLNNVNKEGDEQELNYSNKILKHNIKTKRHNQKTNYDNDNSEYTEYNVSDYSHEHDDVSNNSEEGREVKTTKKYLRKTSENDEESKEVNKNKIARKEYNIPEHIDLTKNNRNKSLRTQSNTYRNAAQKHEYEEEQFREDSDKQKYSSKTEGRSNAFEIESEEIPEIYELHEEVQTKPNKQDTIRLPTRDAKTLHRTKRSIAEKYVKDGDKWADDTNETSHQKLKSNAFTNVELQSESQNYKENKHFHTDHRTGSEVMMIGHNMNLPRDNEIKSAENQAQMSIDDMTLTAKENDNAEDYVNSNEYDEVIGDENYDCEELNGNLGRNKQNSINHNSAEYNNDKGRINNKYWKFRSDGSLEYFSDPNFQQLRNRKIIKREVTFNPSNDNSLTASILPVGNMRDMKDVEIAMNKIQRSSLKSGNKFKTDITNAGGINKLNKAQEEMLNVELYENTLEPKSINIRLPKAIGSLLNIPKKLTSKDLNYEKSLIFKKENLGHNSENKIQPDQELERNAILNTIVPVQILQEVQVDESNLLLGKPEDIITPSLEDTSSSITSGKSIGGIISQSEIKEKTSKLHKTRWNKTAKLFQSKDVVTHSSEEVVHDGHNKKLSSGIVNIFSPTETTEHKHGGEETLLHQHEHGLASDIAENLVEDITTAHSHAINTAPKKNSVLQSDVKPQFNFGKSASKITATNTESATKIFPVIDDIRGNVHSIIDRIGASVGRITVKKNGNQNEEIENLKIVHDTVKKTEDGIFQHAYNQLNPGSIDRAAADTHLHSDKKSLILPHTVHIMPKILIPKGEILLQEEHFINEHGRPLRDANKILEDYLNNTGSASLSNDDIYSKFEGFSSEITDAENNADPLIRNAKDIGHLKHIATRKESLNFNVLDNPINDHNTLQLSTLARRNQLKAELERKHIERLQAMAIHQAKLKEELLKRKIVTSESKIKLTHHVRRRDVTLNKGHKDSLNHSSDTGDSHMETSGSIEDTNGYGDEDGFSSEFKHSGVSSNGSNLPTEQSSNEDFIQDRNWWKEQIIFPTSVENLKDVEETEDNIQQVYKSQNNANNKEPETSPENNFVYLPDHEDQESIEKHSDIYSIGNIPLLMLFGMQPLTLLSDILLAGQYNEEKDSNKQVILQEPSLNFKFNENENAGKDKEDEFQESHYVTIKQVPIPMFFQRLVLDRDPMRLQFNNMTINENKIRYFDDSEMVESDEQDLSRTKKYTLPFLQTVEGSPVYEYPYSLLNKDYTEEVSQNNNLKQQNNENVLNEQVFLLPTTEEGDISNEMVYLEVDLIPEMTRKKKTNEWNVDKAIKPSYNDKKYRKTETASQNKLDHSEHSSFAIDVPDRTISSLVRKPKVVKNAHKHKYLHKEDGIMDAKRNNVDNSSKLPSGSETEQIIPKRSKRALAYQLNDESNSDLLGSSTLINSPLIKSDKYRLRNLIQDLSSSLDENKEDELLKSSIFNELSSSSMESGSNKLTQMEHIKHSHKIPTKFYRKKNIRLNADLENVLDKERETNHAHLENLGTYLNNIINGEVNNDRINDYKEDKTVEIKEIPYKIYKKVSADANNDKISKYIYSHKRKHKDVTANRKEVPSSQDASSANGSNISNETSDENNDVFNIMLEEFSNKDKKSKKLSGKAKTHSFAVITDETQNTISQEGDLAIDMQNKDNSLIPQDDSNYIIRKEKNVAVLEQVPGYIDNLHVDSNNINEKRKPISPTGQIHRFVKNMSDHVVKFFHKISPWNMFSH